MLRCKKKLACLPVRPLFAGGNVESIQRLNYIRTYSLLVTVVLHGAPSIYRSHHALLAGKMSQSSKATAAERHAKLLRSLASKLRHRNSEQSSAFKDVFTAHQGLLHLNEKLRQQTLQQDKVLTLWCLGLGFCHGPTVVGMLYCSMRLVSCPLGWKIER